MLEFKRWLNQDLVDALNKVKGNWWNKIIHDKDLHLGIRYNYLDVYYLGNQLFNINLLKDNGLCCTTHYKYLLHPKEKLCYLSFSADGTLSRDDFSDLFIRNLNNDDALNSLLPSSVEPICICRININRMNLSFWSGARGFIKVTEAI